MSENVESKETIDAALDRAGDMQISFSLQVTIRGAMKRERLYLTRFCIAWRAPSTMFTWLNTREPQKPAHRVGCWV